ELQTREAHPEVVTVTSEPVPANLGLEDADELSELSAVADLSDVRPPTTPLRAQRPSDEMQQTIRRPPTSEQPPMRAKISEPPPLRNPAARADAPTLIPAPIISGPTSPHAHTIHGAAVPMPSAMRSSSSIGSL